MFFPEQQASRGCCSFHLLLLYHKHSPNREDSDNGIIDSSEMKSSKSPGLHIPPLQDSLPLIFRTPGHVWWKVVTPQISPWAAVLFCLLFSRWFCLLLVLRRNRGVFISQSVTHHSDLQDRDFRNRLMMRFLRSCKPDRATRGANGGLCLHEHCLSYQTENTTQQVWCDIKCN